MINQTIIKSLQQRIHKIIRDHSQGISEYELLKQLQNEDVFPELDGKENLLMFRQHFLLMHCLYTLQEKMITEEQLYLTISPIKINITATKKSTSSGTEISATEISEHHSEQALKEYYMDLNYFYDTSSGDVEGLLKSFWQEYARQINGGDALGILELPAGASKEKITVRYRQLIAKHHPDKGGDKEEFIKIRAAYEVLTAKP
ncbi:DNA-J related domain-containing protein [Aurantivibrio infirmus]